MNITPVTGLYVPGDRTDRFEKALHSGAELVVFDLEDAVPPARKQAARAETAAWLRQHAGEPGPVIQIRVNAGDDDDLDAVAGLPGSIEVRVPKIERVADLDRVRDRVGRRSVTALIESAAGVLGAERLAAHDAVTRIALGEADLAAELGPGRPIVDHARVTLVLAAAAAGLERPMLSVFPAIENLAGLTADTRAGAEIGFAGRMAVHPKQLPAIMTAFRPSDAEVAWAREVLAVTARGGVHRTAKGDMVDEPMRQRAERILARESALGA